MLTTLYIRNFITIESLDLDLADGMTTLTGETGAGKSILIDALGLVLGDKADSGLIRNGCDKAEISAEFSITRPEARAWFKQHEIPLDDNSFIVRRVLSTNGRSKVFINTSMVTLSQLGALCDQLVDIHGQHAHQSLGSRQHQRQLLDGYAAHDGLRNAVESSWQRWRQMHDELARLTAARDERQDQLTLLRFKLDELDKLMPLADEWQQLSQQQRRLANAQTLISQSQQIANLLYGDDGAESQLQGAVTGLESLCELDPSLNDSLQMARSALIELQEASSSVQGYADRVELDPQQLAEVDERLGLYHTLARKYQCEPDGLNRLQQELMEKLATLELADEHIDKLAMELERALADWNEAAEKLTKSRKSAAKKLALAVTRQIRELAMPNGEFLVTLTSQEKQQPTQHGKELIEFLVSANPGIAPQPIAKIASGGELSRISLAIQVVTAGISQVETLIFDEVDVGIGGATAEVVGKLLRELGAEHQVLCVTHLPQVASQAHHHLRVEKLSGEKVTHSVVRPLDQQQRIEEVARMLGGVEITERTLDHAAEMVTRGNASS